MSRIVLGLFVLALAACSSTPTKDTVASQTSVETTPPVAQSPYPPAQQDPSKRGDYTAGGLYAPGVADSAPEGELEVDQIPEPEVKDEPRSRAGNKSTYKVLGKSYSVLKSANGYSERGLASYYGKKFHGRRTSNMEVFDMYAISAAHRSLPLPSYVRVTHLGNGRSIVVRVNDRGPFHSKRIIDLSYAAAVKLGMLHSGVANVEVRALSPKHADKSKTQTRTMATSKSNKPATTPTTIDQVIANLPDASTSPGVVLQVASFTARDNAQRALSRLLDAGIAQAQLIDSDSGGQSLWRLRVGPLAADAVEELSSRISGLGFDPPHAVRE